MTASSPPFGPRSIADIRAELGTSGPAQAGAALEARLEAAAALNAFTVVAENVVDAPTQAGRGPLAAIPFAVKDNIDALPFPTTGGSPALRDLMPESDAPAVARVRAAGARMVAKTNLHELAFGVTSNNALFGPVRNPFDPVRVAGGSSGGNGVAVALGVVPFALGTDTGGSVRIPAAFCGIVGFRPSTGRYPAGGVLTLSSTRDTIGIMAAAVADTALVDAVICGSADASSHPAQPIRLGLLGGPRSGLSRRVDDAFAQAVDTLRSGGIEIVPVDEPAFASADDDIGDAIAVCEIADVWSRFAADRFNLTLAEFAGCLGSPDVREAFEGLGEAARRMRPAYEARGDRLLDLQARYRAIFAAKGLVGLLTLTVPVQPPLIGDDRHFVSDGAALPTFATLIRTTALATLLGTPSISLPAGLDADGLPVGLQVDGVRGADRQLLGIAAALEAILGRNPTGARP